MSNARVSLNRGRHRYFHRCAQVEADYVVRTRNAWQQVYDLRGNSEKRIVSSSKRQGWRTVRIFVSSTFVDFHAERDYLVKTVFPRLRSWCEQRRIQLIDCDLRWGVPKDSTSDTTMRMCLREIDRCFDENTYPFFLNMTGKRCGWVPKEDEVPEGVREEYSWIFGMSMTEMEIIHSSYRPDNPNALFMLRDNSFIEELPEKKRSEFSEKKPEAKHKLRMLKRDLMNSFSRDQLFYYSCKYNGIDDTSGLVRLSGLRDFGDKVFCFFKARIKDQYPLEEVEMDEHAHQKDMHNAFMETRSATLIGRGDILKAVDEYVLADEDGPRVPFVIHGGPGLGKSSVMARLADVYTKRVTCGGELSQGDGKGWKVFYHFVGATPGSSDPQLMLKRLLIELGIFSADNIPSALNEVSQAVYLALSNENTPPCVIIIDAVNQLDNADDESVFSWLPKQLSSHVRIVMSMINESSPHRILSQPDENRPIELPVPPLEINVRKEIVTKLFKRYNKVVTDEHMDILMAKRSSENPLWLLVACEELRVFGQFDKVGEKIQSLEDDLLGLLGQVLKRFENESGGRLLVACLCLLECSRHGLLESELLQLLANEGELFPEEHAARYKNSDGENEKDADDVTDVSNERLPYIKWSKVYHALRPYLRPLGESGEGRLDFYHRSLSKAVRNAYFKNDKGEEDDMHKWWRKKLSEFFAKDSNLARKVEEYPYQLRLLGDKESLRATLLDWDVMYQLYDEGYSLELLEYWRFAVPSFGDIAEAYKEKLQELINSSDESFKANDDIALRHLEVGNILKQAGEGYDAKSLFITAMRYETEELGSRPERMAALLECQAKIAYETEIGQKCRIEQCRQAIEIRKALTGRQNKRKLGETYIANAFFLGEWSKKYGSEWLSKEQARQEAKNLAKQAIAVFEELNDLGKLAHAIMVDADIMDPGSTCQLNRYKAAEALCARVLGEKCELMTKIYHNIGVSYGRQEGYDLAYDYYRKSYFTRVEVYGATHDRTKRAYDILHKARYKEIALARGENIPENPGLEAARLESIAESEKDPQSRIENYRQAIKIRKSLTGRDNKLKLGDAYTDIAFAMNQWAKKCGSELARREAKIFAEQAIEVFEELNYLPELARAIAVDADINYPGPHQIKRYKEAEALCARALGEKCVQITGIYYNIAVSYEKQKLYDLAYEYFRKCYFTCVEEKGANNPMTKSAYGILHQPRYKAVAEERGDTIPE